MTNIEHVPDFIVGSKWVAKCSITALENGEWHKGEIK